MAIRTSRNIPNANRYSGFVKISLNALLIELRILDI